MSLTPAEGISEVQGYGARVTAVSDSILQQFVYPEDRLISINSRDVKSLQYTDILEIISESPLPLTIIFQIPVCFSLG